MECSPVSVSRLQQKTLAISFVQSEFRRGEDDIFTSLSARKQRQSFVVEEWVVHGLAHLQTFVGDGRK